MNRKFILFMFFEIVLLKKCQSFSYQINNKTELKGDFVYIEELKSTFSLRFEFKFHPDCELNKTSFHHLLKIKYCNSQTCTTFGIGNKDKEFGIRDNLFIKEIFSRYHLTYIVNVTKLNLNQDYIVQINMEFNEDSFENEFKFKTFKDIPRELMQLNLIDHLVKTKHVSFCFLINKINDKNGEIKSGYLFIADIDANNYENLKNKYFKNSEQFKRLNKIKKCDFTSIKNEPCLLNEYHEYENSEKLLVIGNSDYLNERIMNLNLMVQIETERHKHLSYNKIVPNEEIIYTKFIKPDTSYSIFLILTIEDHNKTLYFMIESDQRVITSKESNPDLLLIDHFAPIFQLDHLVEGEFNMFLFELPKINEELNGKILNAYLFFKKFSKKFNEILDRKDQFYFHDLIRSKKFCLRDFLQSDEICLIKIYDNFINKDKFLIIGDLDHIDINKIIEPNLNKENDEFDSIKLPVRSPFAYEIFFVYETEIGTKYDYSYVPSTVRTLSPLIKAVVTLVNLEIIDTCKESMIFLIKLSNIEIKTGQVINIYTVLIDQNITIELNNQSLENAIQSFKENSTQNIFIIQKIDNIGKRFFLIGNKSIVNRKFNKWCSNFKCSKLFIDFKFETNLTYNLFFIFEIEKNGTQVFDYVQSQKIELNFNDLSQNNATKTFVKNLLLVLLLIHIFINKF